VHRNDGVSSVMRKRSRSAYIFELPSSCEGPADTWLRGSSLTSTPFGAPVGWWTSRSRWWSWYDRCKGAEEAESSSGLSSAAARVRAQRVPRGWGGPGLHEPRTGHPAHPVPLSCNPAGTSSSPTHRHSSTGLTDIALTPALITLSGRPRAFTSHTLSPAVFLPFSTHNVSALLSLNALEYA
jgi:hypothetical protein